MADLILYDKYGIEYEAQKVSYDDIPSFQEGFGRYWDSVVKFIDGQARDFFIDITRGRYYYFLLENEWYRIDAYDFYNFPQTDKFYSSPLPEEEFPERLPIGNVDVSQIRSVLQQAAQQLVKVRIRYVKMDGTVEDYVIEPYSFREKNGRTFLYGYPEHTDNIEMYAVDRILFIELTDFPFSPKWPVEF
jgi:hypothetical protein